MEECVGMSRSTEHVPLMTFQTNNSNGKSKPDHTIIPLEQELLLPRGWRNKTVEFKDKIGEEVGCYQSGSKRYIKIPSKDLIGDGITDSLDTLKNVMIAKDHENGWKLEMPKMVINMIGHVEQYGHTLESLQQAIQCLFKMTKNTWIITEGYDTCFNNHVGRAVKALQEECNSIENEESNVKVTSIGISKWNRIVGSDNLDIEESPDIHTVYDISTLPEKDEKFILNENNTHFVMVDGKGCSGSDLRTQFFHKFNVPRANLVVGGGKKTLHTIRESLQLGIPCILMEGSGGFADEIAPLLKMQQRTKNQFSENDTNSLVEQHHSTDMKISKKDLKTCMKHAKLFVICSTKSLRKTAIQEVILDSYMIELQNLTDTGIMAKELVDLCHSWNCIDQTKQALGYLGKHPNDLLVTCFVEFLEAKIV